MLSLGEAEVRPGIREQPTLVDNKKTEANTEAKAILADLTINLSSICIADQNASSPTRNLRSERRMTENDKFRVPSNFVNG